MDSHQAHIIEYSGTVELQMLRRIQFCELTSLFLKEYTYFLRSSSKEEMLRHANISLALKFNIQCKKKIVFIVFHTWQNKIW